MGYVAVCRTENRELVVAFLIIISSGFVNVVVSFWVVGIRQER